MEVGAILEKSVYTFIFLKLGSKHFNNLLEFTYIFCDNLNIFIIFVIKMKNYYSH